MQAARVAHLLERFDDWWEIHLAFAEHEVLVDAALHVLDVNVAENVFPAYDVRAGRHFTQAMQVADVKRQAEAGRRHALPQPGVALHGVDEHAGLRLESQANVPRVSMV